MLEVAGPGCSSQALPDADPRCSTGVAATDQHKSEGASDAAGNPNAHMTQSDDIMLLVDAAPEVPLHSTSTTPPVACTVSSSAGSQAPLSRSAPGHEAPANRQQPSLPHSSASHSTASSQDEKTSYLQGLLDVGFGPPKFTVPRAQPDTPAASLTSGVHSDPIPLEQLLSTTLGPPKFPVPKPDPPPSPPCQQPQEQDLCSFIDVDIASLHKEPSPSQPGLPSHTASGASSDLHQVVNTDPGALPEVQEDRHQQQQQQQSHEQQPPPSSSSSTTTTHTSCSSSSATPSSTPMLAAVTHGPPGASSSSSGSGGESCHTLASPASASMYQQLNSKLPRASSKRASVLPAVAESLMPHLRLELTSGPDTGKVLTVTCADTNYRIGRLPQCEFQIMDQEVSGKHAELCWSSADRVWKLTDAGSLNGTLLNGKVISTQYREMGLSHPLSDGDAVEFGSLTKSMVTLVMPAEDPATGCDSGGSVTKRRHAGKAMQSLSVPREGAPPSGRPDANQGRQTFAFGSGSRHPLLAPCPPPLASLHLPHLRAHLAVQQKVGVDHAHLGQACEDVVHWEERFPPFTNTALLCLFDGHQGVRAASAAKTILPAVLRSAALAASLAPPSVQSMYAHPASPHHATHQGTPPPASASPAADAVALPGPQSAAGEAAAAAVAPESAAAPDGAAADACSPEAAAHSLASGPAVGEPHPATLTSTPAAAAATAAAAGGSAGAQAQADHVAGSPPRPLLGWRSVESQRALLTAVFLEADAQMGMDEGCTASAVLVQAEAGGSWVVQSANVGDSSAILVDVTSHQWVKLTGDHRISTSAAERERLEKRGHTVRTRLYGLNISRMLGDRCLKEENLGFLAEPHVSTAATVPAGHVAYLIMASDGLWDVVPEATAATQLLRAADTAAAAAVQHASAPVPLSLQQDGSTAGSGGSGEEALEQQLRQLQQEAGRLPSVEELASALLQQALLLRSKDDISIMVMKLSPDAQ
ncbi:MAG: hypothetical protein WDW36_004283 [Sanguina aurantia]